jgi:hypothetical protein
MADAHRAGVPAITLNGLATTGEAPFWHQVEDTFDKIDPEVLTRAYAFTWQLLQHLDRHGLAEAGSDLG